MSKVKSCSNCWHSDVCDSLVKIQDIVCRRIEIYQGLKGDKCYDELIKVMGKHCGDYRAVKK